MSLKNRLRVSIVTLVSLLVLAQCVMSLRITAEASFKDVLDRAGSVAYQVRNMLLQRVNEQTVAAFPPPANLEESKKLWRSIIAEDTALPELLKTTVASWTTLVEILVCDEDGQILTASHDRLQRRTYQSLQNFTEWNRRFLWDRLLEVLLRPREYATVLPLGVQGAPRPMFTIRVILSSVLLRDVIMPQVRSLAILTALSMIGSMILAVLFSNVVLKALERVSHRIELISTGRFGEDAAVAARESREFAVVQNKLDILSQQFRGAKEDVNQLRGNFEQMLERLEQAVLLFDSEHRLVLASRQAGRLLGCPPGELMGKTMEELLPPSTALGAVVDRALKLQQSLRDRPVLFERQNGQPERVLMSVDPLLSIPGGRFGTLITLQDAETRRQLRSQLDVSTRLAAISRLTGGVAHEIKNPLNAMAVHLEILKSKLPDATGVEGECDVIGREIARLDRVVSTFLDFARPVELMMREVDLAEMARQIATLVRPEAERNQVLVECQTDGGPAVVHGDHDLLKQAILNVVMNGIEAMPNGGRLQIRVSCDVPEVLFSVADAGTGIPPQLRDRIFNLYFSTKEKGSGIGLAMTFRVVQLHNATIDFTSDVGHGTTFLMRFPVDEESVQGAYMEFPVAEPAEKS